MQIQRQLDLTKYGYKPDMDVNTFYNFIESLIADGHVPNNVITSLDISRYNHGGYEWVEAYIKWIECT